MLRAAERAPHVRVMHSLRFAGFPGAWPQASTCSCAGCPGRTDGRMGRLGDPPAASLLAALRARTGRRHHMGMPLARQTGTRRAWGPAGGVRRRGTCTRATHACIIPSRDNWNRSPSLCMQAETLFRLLCRHSYQPSDAYSSMGLSNRTSMGCMQSPRLSCLPSPNLPRASLPAMLLHLALGLTSAAQHCREQIGTWPRTCSCPAFARRCTAASCAEHRCRQPSRSSVVDGRISN